MLITKVRPGDQVITVPGWVVQTINRNGQLTDVANFAKMRQWFTQEQLVAMAAFSDFGLNILNGPYTTSKNSSGPKSYHRSLFYVWFFSEEHGVAKNGDEADNYAKCQLSNLEENDAYRYQMVNEYVVSYFAQPTSNQVDLSQSYSVYPVSEKLVVLALNQGLMTPGIYDRKDELHLMVLRTVLEKLYGLHPPHEVHKSDWFSWYLAALERLK